MSLSPRRSTFALFACVALPLLAGCPKKETPPFDAGPPPPPPEDVQTVLTEMVEDAGEPDADAETKPKWTGPAQNTNVTRFKQCCAALAAEAKRMGSSPEAGMFSAAAAQCNATAAHIGPAGTAPELGALRGLLAGRNVPAICAGF